MVKKKILTIVLAMTLVLSACGNGAGENVSVGGNATAEGEQKPDKETDETGEAERKEVVIENGTSVSEENAEATEQGTKPEEFELGRIAEITTTVLNDFNDSYDYYDANGDVIITYDGMYGAVDYFGREIVPNEYIYCYGTVNSKGYFAMGGYDGTALVFDAEGNVVFSIPNIVLIWLGEEEIIYAYWDSEGGNSCDLGCYNLNSKTAELWETDFVIARRPYFNYCTNGGYGAVTCHKANFAGIMSPGYCKTLPGNEKLAEYYASLEGGDVSEQYLINMAEFYSANDIGKSAEWQYMTYYEDGQYRANVGKQIVVHVVENSTETSYLIDFEKAQTEVVEYVNVRGENCKEYHVTNIEDIIVGKYDYIEMSSTGIYLAGSGNDFFYINQEGTKIADYDDCSAFNGDGYALIMEEGMAYVIDTDFNKVSEGYPADLTYTKTDSLVIKKGNEKTCLFTLSEGEAKEYEQIEQEMEKLASFIPGMVQGIYETERPRYSDYCGFYAEVYADELHLYIGRNNHIYTSADMTTENGNYVLSNENGKLEVKESGSGYKFTYDNGTPNNYTDDFNRTMLKATKTHNGMPLDGYVSLDGLGEWGPIPVDDKIKSILLNGMSDDYEINYNPNGSFMSVAGARYISKSYNEDGHCTDNIWLYVFRDEELAAKAYEEVSKDIYVLEGNMIIYDDREVIGEYPNEHSKGIGNGFTMVYGNHCYHHKVFNEYYYYSKPISVEEGKENIRVSEFIATYAGDYYLNGSYNGNYIRVDGSAVEPTEIGINYEDFYRGGIDDVILTEEEHLIGIGHDQHAGYTFVMEIIIDGYDLVAYVKDYAYDPTITLENYTGRKPRSERTMTGTIPSSVRGFPMV